MGTIETLILKVSEQGALASLLLICVLIEGTVILHLYKIMKEMKAEHTASLNRTMMVYKDIIKEKTDDNLRLWSEKNEAWKVRNDDLRDILEVLHKQVEFFEYFKSSK